MLGLQRLLLPMSSWECISLSHGKKIKVTERQSRRRKRRRASKLPLVSIILFVCFHIERRCGLVIILVFISDLLFYQQPEYQV